MEQPLKNLPMKHAQEPEDEGESRWQDERVEYEGGVRCRAASAASDEARKQVQRAPANR